MTKNIFPIGFTSWMFLHSKGNIKYCLDFFPVLFPSFSGLFCIICASAVELSFTASFHRVLVLACWYFVVVENFVKKLSKNINCHNTRSRSQLTKITKGMKLLVKGNDFWHLLSPQIQKFKLLLLLNVIIKFYFWNQKIDEMLLIILQIFSKNE